jgi:hypothetical protein
MKALRSGETSPIPSPISIVILSECDHHAISVDVGIPSVFRVCPVSVVVDPRVESNEFNENGDRSGSDSGAFQLAGNTRHSCSGSSSVVVTAKAGIGTSIV